MVVYSSYVQQYYCRYSVVISVMLATQWYYLLLIRTYIVLNLHAVVISDQFVKQGENSRKGTTSDMPGKFQIWVSDI